MSTMPDIPYKPRVKLGSLRQTSKKMMVTKTSGAKVGDEKLKKFLKEEKGLRRMAYGDKESTVESWRGRHYFKDVKEKLEGSDQYRESVYGQKSTVAKAFRDTVREEVRQEQTTVHQPTKDELERQKRLGKAREHLRQFDQSKQIEKESGKPLAGGLGVDPGAAGGSSSSPPRAVPLSGGSGGRSAPGPVVPASSVAVSGSLGADTISAAAKALPSTFGFRGRVLRHDAQQRELFVHILNAPPELAVFIGRDRTVKYAPDAHCWEERHPLACSDIRASDHIDARGKILNNVFIADELHLNRADLPDFVTHLNAPEPPSDIPAEPPSDLVI